MTSSTLRISQHSDAEGMLHVCRSLAGLVKHHRARRTAALLACVVILSVIDLIMTIKQMRTHGMAEGNPLVVHLVRYTHSALIIGLYKLLTVTVSVTVLYRLRRFVQAELATWCAVAILSCLTVQWVRYAGYMGGLEPSTLSRLHEVDPDWAKLG